MYSIIYPSIAIKYIDSTCLINNMIQGLIKQKYDWLILTSANGVRSLFYSIHQKMDISIISYLFKNIKIAVIGIQTRKIFHDIFKIYPDIMPIIYNSISLIKKILHMKNKTFLLLQSNLASHKLYKDILKRGGFIDRIIIYCTIADQNKNKFFKNINIIIKERMVIITFMSPSALFYFILNIKNYNISIKKIKKITIACIGKYTATIAKRIGLNVHIIPINSNLNDFIYSIRKYIFLKG